MATPMGLEPTVTGETVQRISRYATEPYKAFYTLEKAVVSWVSLLSHITTKRTSTFLIPWRIDRESNSDWTCIQEGLAILWDTITPPIHMAAVVGFEPTRAFTLTDDFKSTPL